MCYCGLFVSNWSACMTLAFKQELQARFKDFSFMSHHDYSAPKQKETEDISVDDNDEDPVVSMIARTGCSNEHYAILDCMSEKKDWRHCQEFVKNFKDCMKKHGNL